MAKTTHSLFTIRWKDGPEKKPSDIGGHSDHITLGLGLRLGGVRFRTLGMFSWRSFILFASSGPGGGTRSTECRSSCFCYLQFRVSFCVNIIRSCIG